MNYSNIENENILERQNPDEPQRNHVSTFFQEHKTEIRDSAQNQKDVPRHKEFFPFFSFKQARKPLFRFITGEAVKKQIISRNIERADVISHADDAPQRKHPFDTNRPKDKEKKDGNAKQNLVHGVTLSSGLAEP